MLKKLRKNERGFTLVELLAVIVILGIIAAIAVPSIGKIIDNTKEDAKVAEAIQIINAAKIYHASHPNSNTMDDSVLSEYLENVVDNGYTVTYNSSGYSLTNHEGVKVVNGKKSKNASETELIDYSQGN